MGILTNIVAAEEDEYAAIGESLRPVDEWSGIERRGIDTAKIATLHCLLTGDEFEEAVGNYEPVYVGDEGAVVLRIADDGKGFDTQHVQSSSGGGNGLPNMRKRAAELGVGANASERIHLLGLTPDEERPLRTQLA